MDRVIFVEILDRRGNVRRRERVETTPFRIGRSLAAGVILDDPHASPEHLEIDRDEDGVLTARDLGSENGTRVLSHARLVGTVKLTPETRLRVGRTVVRIRTPDDPLHPTLLEARGIGAWITSHWSAALVLLALVLAASALRIYEFVWADATGFQLGNLVVMPILGFVIWPSGWAISSRLVRGSARFGAHWAVGCGLFIASRLLDEGAALAAFFSAPISTLQYGTPLLQATILAIAIHLHLGICGVLGLRKRAVASGLVAFAMVGAFGVDALSSPPKWTNELPFWSDLLYVDSELLPTREADDFFDGVESLGAKLDVLAESE